MLLKIHRSFDRIRRHFVKDDCGATALEFAFVGGPFLFLLLATFETGLVYVTEYSLQKATTTASRLIRTGQVQSGISKAGFKNELCKAAPSYINCDKIIINVETRTDFADAANRTQASDGEGNLRSDLQTAPSWQPGNSGDIVVMEAFYEWQLFTPGINKLLDLHGTTVRPAFLANHGDKKRLITGVAVFRNEPF
jgi:Flp pilus assembly protein TadG